MVLGYKCFYSGMISRFGEKFEVGVTYHAEGDIKFRKQGFYMCKNLEDTLRYFDALNNEVDIAEVRGYGEINKYNDEYNGYYDMYAVENLVIKRILSRDEIIRYMLILPSYRVKRFISLYHLTNDEIELFKKYFAREGDVIKTIEYYQENNSKAFIKIK